MRCGEELRWTVMNDMRLHLENMAYGLLDVLLQ